MSDEVNLILRQLPSVDELSKLAESLPQARGITKRYLVSISRKILENLRADIVSKKSSPKNPSEKALELVEKELQDIISPALKRVINLTGIFVHTNLGRSPLSSEAVDALKTAEHYCNLEYDISERKRGKRDRNLAKILSLITGCEHFLLANNNAAALFLILNSFARGKKVAVSRGELIEIGGSFRIPDIMRASGAKLVEVGTTNRTHLYDYEKAADDGAFMFLKVHSSNYRVVGFTESVSVDELVALAKQKNILCVEDLGSGSLIDLSDKGFPKEPTVQDSLAKGMDLVTFSLDKLLGGPQGGLVLGKKELIDKMNRNPIKRVVRCGKLTLLALEATLRSYLREDELLSTHPLYRNLFVSELELRERGTRLIDALKRKFGDAVTYNIKTDSCYMGGGSLPEQAIPSLVIELIPVKISLNHLVKIFSENDPPIIGRVSEDKLIFDLRQLENISDAVPSLEL